MFLEYVPRGKSVVAIERVIRALNLTTSRSTMEGVTRCGTVIVTVDEGVGLAKVGSTRRDLIGGVCSSLAICRRGCFPGGKHVLSLKANTKFPKVPLTVLQPSVRIILISSILGGLMFVRGTTTGLKVGGVGVLRVHTRRNKQQEGAERAFSVIATETMGVLPIVTR